MWRKRDNMTLLLNCINYNTYPWQLRWDLEVVAALLGLQQGYIKFCCFLCEWNNRTKTSHYMKRDWSSWQALELGKKTVQYLPLVESSKMLLYFLHIKQGLMKNFVRTVDQAGLGFTYLDEKFPGISAAKKRRKVVLLVHRSASSSEMNSLNAFSLVTRRRHGMVSGL